MQAAPNHSNVIPAALAMLARAFVDDEPVVAFAIRERASAEVIAVLKAAVSHITSNDIPPAAVTAKVAFIESLRAKSAFTFLLNGGYLRRVPIETRIAATEDGVTAFAIFEGQIKPASRLRISQRGLLPAKAAGLLILTKETLKNGGAAGTAFIEAELRGACAEALDAAFISRLSGGSSPSDSPSFASSGDTADAAREDLRQLLSTVATKGSGALAWIMAPEVANAFSLWTQDFPGMSPNGGTLLNLPALVTSAAGAGQLHLIDGSGVAAEIDDVLIKQSGAANIQFDDAPDSPATASTVSISMFQTNSVAMMAEVTFGAAMGRPNAFATVTDIEYGSAA